MSAPIELAMEEALRPGRYISEHVLYETFIAACYEKAGEVDDGHVRSGGV